MAEQLDSLLDEEIEEKKPNKILIILITVIIVLIWLAIFALLIKLDVGGFGSKVLRPILKDIPVINMILPDATDEEVGLESKYPYTNLSDAIARIEELENENLVLREAIEVNRNQITELSAEVARLTPFEAYQKRYEQLKKDFDEQVVFGNDYIGNYAADPEEYIKWYETIDPENAALMYEQALERKSYSDEIMRLATSYSKMKPAQAAAILEEMTGDEEKVATILSAMKEANAASILASMDSLYAAKITVLMYPTRLMVEEYNNTNK